MDQEIQVYENTWQACVTHSLYDIYYDAIDMNTSYIG